MNRSKLAVRFLSLVLLIVFSVPMMPSPANGALAAGRVYRALLIGNNAYTSSPLTGCINDALAIKAVLSASSGAIKYDRIEKKENLTKAGLVAAFEGLQNWGINENDVTFIFYSGHGYDIKPYGIVGTDMVRYSYLDIEQLLAKVPGRIVIMIDACYSGGIIDKALIDTSAKALNASIHSLFGKSAANNAKALVGPKYQVITAASKFEKSYESPSTQSGYFSTYLTAAMSTASANGQLVNSTLTGDTNYDYQLSMMEAYTYTSDRVKKIKLPSNQNIQMSPLGSSVPIVSRYSYMGLFPLEDGLPNLKTAVISISQQLQMTTTDYSKWKSSDESIARVSDYGLITPVKTGKCSIYRYTNGAKDLTMKLTVAKETKTVQSFSLNYAKMTRYVGQKLSLKASKFKPSSPTSKAIMWYSTDKSVATVSSSGVVTPKASGKATIYAISTSGVTQKCDLTVIPKLVTKVQQKYTKVSVKRGKTFKLTAKISPTDATVKKLEWSSDNERVAVVGPTGIVRGISKGTCNITAKSTDGTNISKSCKVTIK